jgi:superfamily II DNA or RNA helicase
MSINIVTVEDRRVLVKWLVKALNVNEMVEILSGKDSLYLALQDKVENLTENKKAAFLAEMLVLILGNNIFADQKLRNILFKKQYIKSVENWKPGSSQALDVCSALNMPEVFSGMQTSTQYPVVENIPINIGLGEMMDYQKEAYEKSLISLKEGNSTLLSMPTGSGKTRVATHVLVEIHKLSNVSVTSVWIAHTEELCEQAVKCILQTWKALNINKHCSVIRAWGSNVNKIIHGERYVETNSGINGNVNDCVIITTPHFALSILEEKSAGPFKQIMGNLQIVIIDEAHRAAAETYKKIIRKVKGKYLLGLSATPIRESYRSSQYAGTIELATLFTKMIEPTDTLGSGSTPEEALYKRGVLSRIETVYLPMAKHTASKLSDVIATSLEKDKSKKPGLAFTSNAAISKVLGGLLVKKGWRSEYLTADSSAADRIYVVDRLKDGSLDMLCNCEVLTTGFDAPQIGKIFMARNTQSPVLYKQIIGRGMRGVKMGGAEKCIVYLCGINLNFPANPNTSEFAKSVWGN